MAQDRHDFAGQVSAATLSIPFDQIVRRVTKGSQPRIHLLTLDCAAVEYPILYTAQALALIDALSAASHPWLADAPEFQVDGFRNRHAVLRHAWNRKGLPSRSKAITCGRSDVARRSEARRAIVHSGWFDTRAAHEVSGEHTPTPLSSCAAPLCHVWPRVV